MCGSDNRTYNNQCLLEVAKCRTRSNLQVSGPGPCEKAGSTGQSMTSGGSNTDEKVEIIEARQEDQGKKPREHFLIRGTWCSKVCAMRCHHRTTSYLVLLLSLYFNGPPPDETFRFHRLLQSVESVELPIDFSPSILEMESLNSYFIIKAAADGRRRLICQLPYLPAGISRWRFILVLECRLAFFPYTEHSSQTLAVLSSVVSGNTTGAEDGVSS